MLSKMRNRKGFTLIELMIVVAIIGILAAIAIPNFLKFQAKSKTSEAKTNLKAIYTAQTSYYSEEYTYGNFLKINWIPAGKNLLYGYSLSATGPQGGQFQPTAGIIQVDSTGLEIFPTKPWTGTPIWLMPLDPFPAASSILGLTSTVGSGAGTAPVYDGFVAAAAGVVSPRSTIPDCWVINDNNILYNTLNGV